MMGIVDPCTNVIWSFDLELPRHKLITDRPELDNNTVSLGR